MHALSLDINPQGWRYLISRQADSSFQNLATTVWERDHFKCQYCGVQMKQGREILNILNVDNCYTNNELRNLVTACGFCLQCKFLESIGPGKYGGGLLIYLPEIIQAYLNSFCYALFNAMQKSTPAEKVAQQAYRHLVSRAQLVENHLGRGMSEPANLGQLLAESGDYPTGNTFIANLRLLPLWAAFKDQIESGVVYTQ